MSPLPNFLIIGAQKCGTTALYYWLEQHPEIHLSTPKEPYFFEGEYERGSEYYWQTFFADGYRGQRLTGEARTAHLFLPWVPERIHATLPNARLVAILRNPVQRAYSLWWMMHCNGRDSLSFEKALRRDLAAIEEGRSLEGPDAERRWRAATDPRPNRQGARTVAWIVLLEAGYYARQLERYLQYFPRSQLCMLLHDDLVRQPLETGRRLFEFLGLDPADVRKPPALENVALTRFSRPLFLVSRRLQLDRVLSRKFMGRSRAFLSRFGGRPPMSDTTADWLRQHYAPHNRRLEALLDRDLSAWDL